VVVHPAARPTPNLYVAPEHCRQLEQRTQRPVPLGPARDLSGKLGRQPPADMHLLVDRRVAGCPVPTIVRYGVDAQGPVEGRALRREGAPARRR
jgi:hypothetical protein